MWGQCSLFRTLYGFGGSHCPNALDFLSQFQQRKKARKHAVIESRLENEQINVKGVGKYCLATQGKSSLVSIKRDDVTYKQRNNMTNSSILQDVKHRYDGRTNRGS